MRFTPFAGGLVQCTGGYVPAMVDPLHAILLPFLLAGDPVDAKLDDDTPGDTLSSSASSLSSLMSSSISMMRTPASKFRMISFLCAQIRSPQIAGDGTRSVVHVLHVGAHLRKLPWYFIHALLRLAKDEG